MSTYDEHNSRAEHDDSLLKFFEMLYKTKGAEQFDDWYITISFYSAVQHFEAMLAKVKPEIFFKGYHVRIEHTADVYPLYGITYNTLGGAHRSRLRIIMENDLFSPNLNRAYYWLHNNSHAAKYNNYKPNNYNWGLAKRMLENIKSTCRQLIANKP